MLHQILMHAFVDHLAIEAAGDAVALREKLAGYQKAEAGAA